MLGPASPNALVPQAVSGQAPNQRSMANMFMSASFPADPGVHLGLGRVPRSGCYFKGLYFDPRDF